MSRRAVPISLLLVLGLFLLLGQFFITVEQHATPEDDSKQQAAGAVSDFQSGAAGDTGSRADESSDRLADDGGARTSTPPEDDSAANSLADSVTEDPNGPYLIEGQVLSDSSQPIVAATVTVDHDRELLFRHQLLNLFHRIDQRQHGTASPIGRATTDSDGWFKVQIPRAGLYTLHVRAAGHTDAVERGIRLGADAERALIYFHLPPGVAVRGFVVDEHDRPVVGSSLSLLERSGGGVRSYHARSTTSASDGSFAFEGLEGRSYILMGKTEEHAGVFIPGVMAPKNDLIVTIRENVGFQASVVDAVTGEPVADATVTALNPLSYDQATSNEKGLLTLHLIGVDADVVVDHPDYLLEGERITLPTAANTDISVELRLRRGVNVRGRIVHPNGEPAAAVTVGMLQNGSFLPDIRTVRSDSDGRFLVGPANPAAPLLFLPKLKGWVPTLEGRGAQADGSDESIVELRPAARLVGRIVDRSGRGLGDAWVRIRPGPSMSPLVARAVRWLRGMPETWSDSDGNFEFTDLVPVGGYVLDIQHDDGADTVFPLVVFPESEFTIEVAPGATLAGIIRAADGSIPRSAVLFLEWPGGPTLRQRPRSGTLEGGLRFLARSNGSFRIGRVPPGPATLHVQVPPHLTKSISLVLDANVENWVEVDLDRGFRLEITVSEENGALRIGTTVQILDLTRGSFRRARTDADGVIQFGSLPAGSYRIVQPTTMEFKIDAEGPTTVELEVKVGS